MILLPPLQSGRRRLDFSYLTEHWREVLDLAWDHLTLSLAAVALGFVIAVPLGVLVARSPRLSLPVLGLLGALYTIPSLAFLAILIPSLGIGRRNALVVLVTYTQPFLVRNIVAGLRGVDPPTLDAARGMGLTAWQVFRRVRWPLALPVVLAGVRTALVATISTATVAAWVGAGGLGSLLFSALSLNQPPRIVAGTVAIAALAIGADLALRVLERFTAASRAARALRHT